MQAFDQSNEEDTSDFCESLPGLEQRVTDSLAAIAPDESSNYEAMCIAVSESGLVSKKCKHCKGIGTKNLDPKRAEKWERRLAEEESPTKREELRRERFEETLCRGCGGNGWITTERRRAASPCDDCGGLGSIRGRSCKRCLGHGHVFLGPIDYRGVTTSCGRCKGCGEVFDEDAQDVCALCRGASYTIPCTAFSTGCSKKGRLPPGYEGGSHVETIVTVAAAGAGGSVAWADEQEISELGKDSKLLEEVRRRDPLAATFLETHLGAEGARWSRHLWGRDFATWHHTPSGQRVILESFDAATENQTYRRGAGYLARPADILARERAAEMKAKVPNIRRKALLSKADHENREGLARARKVLLEVAAAA